jgi:ubiquinol-cytochrome c reductase cytochrome c subunit
MTNVFVLLLAVAAPVPPLAAPAPSPMASVSAGQGAYEQNCATCHGGDLRGGANAPPLRGVGAADVDFMLETGRMPAAVPWIEVGHLEPLLSQATIDAIVGYVTSVQPGGPPIPSVLAGNAARGRTLFEENCMHCHGSQGDGAAIGFLDWAPSLDHATLTEVAEAIRVGPGEMPRFGERQLSATDMNDIAGYLSAHNARPDVMLPLATSGPVPEGLLGWLGAGLMAFLAYAFSARGNHG